MTYRNDPWKDFRYKLDLFESNIKHLKFQGAFDTPQPDFLHAFTFCDIGQNSISADQISSILSPDSVGPPHGLDLLKPLPVPQLPQFPAYPSELQDAAVKDSNPQPTVGKIWGIFKGREAPRNDQRPEWQSHILERAAKLQQKLEELRLQFEQQLRTELERLTGLQRGCLENDIDAISSLMKMTHVRHPLPTPLHGSLKFDLDRSARIALCTVEIPDFAGLSIVRKRGDLWKAKWLPVSAAERKRSTETILYSLCLRVAYLVASSDVGGWFDTVAVNASQNWHDAATGVPRQGIIASLQATKEDLLNLHLGQLDPKACFRHFKGISTPSIDRVAPVRPIFVMNTADSRIIENRDVAEQLDQEANLAAMPWEDFEQLVRQLFEWEFGRNGVEVKVTRASRDRGVDAIMFDPDPLRGGKYVLQAKRYTRTVDVAAVRDLYGTVVNEGANRGILVTTSSYGPDSYDFAKDKPISLVDGPNLVAMLKRHGRMFRIDLAEASRKGID